MSMRDTWPCILACGLFGAILLSCSSSDGRETAAVSPLIVYPDPNLPETLCSTFYVPPTAYGGRCSAVAVGERVVLTAKHCLSAGKIPVEFKAGTSFYQWTSQRCVPHPSQDLALCFFSKNQTFPADRIESVSTDPSHLAVGSVVILSGYGCIAGACGGPVWGSTKSRSGRAVIHQAPANLQVFVTASNLAVGQASLCVGDSGGPVCTQSGAAVVGVAKKSCAQGHASRSIATALWHDDTVRWMREETKSDPAFTIRGLVY